MVGPAVALTTARSKLLWAEGRNAQGQYISRARAAGLAAVAGALGGDEESPPPEAKEVFINVSSSAISQIGWKDDVITVVFNSGGSHDYPGDRATFDEFVNAPSIGRYFNANIRPRG